MKIFRSFSLLSSFTYEYHLIRRSIDISTASPSSRWYRWILPYIFFLLLLLLQWFPSENGSEEKFVQLVMVLLQDDDHYSSSSSIDPILILIKRIVIALCLLVLLKEQYCLDQRMARSLLTQAHHVCDLLSLVVVVLNMPEGWWEHRTKATFIQTIEYDRKKDR